MGDADCEDVIGAGTNGHKSIEQVRRDSFGHGRKNGAWRDGSHAEGARSAERPCHQAASGDESGEGIEADGERHKARSPLPVRTHEADKKAHPGDRETPEQNAHGGAEQRHKLHHGGGSADSDGGIRGHIHGAGAVRERPRGYPAGDVTGRSQHSTESVVHDLLRVRLHRPVHILGGGGGTDVSGGDRKQGEEADDGNHQQANVAGVRAHLGGVLGAVIRGGRGARALAGHCGHHHRDHHLGYHFGDHVLLGHRASD